MAKRDRNGWQWVLLFAALAFFFIESPTGYAADYPVKPITLIVSYTPGGGADITARVVAEYLRKKWGQPITVLNVPGGGGVIGVQQALESKPDGYTLLTDVHSTAAMMPAVYENLPFDWKKRTPISRVHVSAPFYLVNSKSPYKTLGDLAKALKENPQKFSWGTAAPSGLSSFVLGQFFDTIGVNFSDTNMVVLGGGAPAYTALAGGHVDIAAGTIDDTYALLSSGKIRALAVVSDKRLPEFPDVPTAAESGYPSLDVIVWQGISGPQGLPQSVVDKWALILQEAARDREFIEMSDKVKKTIGYLGPQDFKAFIFKEYDKYHKLARKMNVVIRRK